MQLSVGDKLGPYEILAPIGAGGMGEVYKAHDTRLNRIVAIKQLKDQHSSRFAREAQAIAALNHSNICQIYDVGPNYLVMEYVEGSPLSGPLRVKEAVKLALQIASAVEEAHNNGILHRDLKPANILVTQRGSAKLLDFGLAKLLKYSDSDTTQTVEGTLLGTPAYMAPEQAEGKTVDERSDIFSFGAVLYEMLAGKRAFVGKSTAQVLSAVLRDDPTPLEAPAEVQRIVNKCLAKKPQERFANMAELRGALEQIDTVKPADLQPSIAVLSFANMSSDKEQEYFSDGLAEEIINLLAHVPGLKVTARTSAFSFKGKDLKVAQIAQELGVEHVLEGSVRKVGSRLRITAQLIKAADGFHLWSERYDRELDDIFAVQDELSAAIVGALRIQLNPQSAATPRYEPKFPAYEAYLRARGQWFKGTSESQALFKQFVVQAIELDPEFALPHMLLGGHYSMLAHLGIRPAREVIPLARAALAEALRLDPCVSEAHALLGVFAGTFSFDWNGAERHWRLAMARQPVSRDVRFWYGNHYLLPIGRLEEAVEAMALGLEGDRLNPVYRHHWARGLRHIGRLGDAESELLKVLEIDEDFPPALDTLGAICAQQGRFADALAFTERASALMPWSNPIRGQLAALLVRTGDRPRADSLIEELRLGKANGAPTGMAVFHALCGEFDQAADWAARAIEEQYPEFIMILGPLLRPTPHWPALAKMMKLPG